MPAVLLSVAAVLVVLAPAANAMDPNRAMSQYLHERWGPERGFPRGPVYAIAQSGDGYLWIATQAGLVRFDGLNFRLVKDVPALVNSDAILGLTPDREGNLWIRLQGATFLRYRDGVFYTAALDLTTANSQITATSETRDGDLLLFATASGVSVYRQGKFEAERNSGPSARSPVLAVAQTSDGVTWMGTRGAGLFRFDQGITSPVTEGLPDLKVNCLVADAGRNLWIGTDDGIVRWDGSKLTDAGLPASFRHLQVLALLKDRDGNIWVGTDAGGLQRLNGQGSTSLDKGEGRSHEAVTALFEDREGDLWIGSDSGIERLRDTAFLTYSLPEGLPSDGSNPVFVDAGGRTWFPPVQGGLWWIKGDRHGRVTNAGLANDIVYSIAGRNDELWLGRQRGGLTELRSTHDSFIARSFTHADGLAQDSVYSVYPSRDGAIWAGTLSAGVSELRDNKFTTYTIENGLASDTVASIIETTDGTMWFATPSGLSALANGHWQTYRPGDGLPSENVNCLFQDSTGVLWVGTAAGLAFRGTHGFQVPQAIPAPLRAQILGIAEDRYGSLWMATSTSVLRVRRDKLLGGILTETDVREYGLADGLRGVQGVKRHQSVVSDSSGRIWFSLDRGISVVDPARLTRNSTPPIVHVQSISADGSPIATADTVHVPGGRRRVTFSFTGLSLAAPEEVHFRYMLEGFDHNWSDPVSSREAIYTNLSPASYRFRLVARNPDGVWSTKEAAVMVVVDPLFWQAWWFRLGCLVIGLTGILGLYRYRLHQLTRQLTLRSEERLAERTRIAQELHDTLLQGFLSASMQVHVAADGLPENAPAKPILTRALQLMSQVIEEGRNAVRGLRASQSESLDLEQAFSLIQQEIAPAGQAGASVNYRVVLEGERRALHPLMRDEVYRIGREALVNAFRHAGARKIELELKYSSRWLRVLVRDDGVGIDPQILQSGRDDHWGLTGMRERADRIGAQLHVWSGASAGTEVELSVPGRVAFQDQPSPLLAWFTIPLRRWRNGRVSQNKNGTRT